MTFAYPGRVPVVRDLSLRLPRGRIVGLAGPDGSGKSTIIHLLVGLYRPDSGRAVVDGRPYDDVDIVATRSRIGVVPQHPVFVSGTVEENLRAGAAADAVDVAWALETAGAASVVGRRVMVQIAQQKRRCVALSSRSMRLDHAIPTNTIVIS